MKKFLDKNTIVLASLMLLLPLSAEAHLSSASGVQGFDASIPGEKMTLQQCFQLADRQNLALQSGRKAVEKAQVMQGTAWDLDKTEIAFSQNPASSGDTDNGLTFSQSIEFPTVYTARRNQLKAETQAEKSRLNVTSQQLRLEIASAYYAMLYQTHRLQILLQQDSVIQRYCDVAGKRYRAGEARQLEFLSADRMRNDNRLEMTKVKNEAENLQTALMALLNTTTPVVPAADNLVISQSSPMNAVFNYQQTADAQYQKDLISALDQEVKCAKTGYAPSLSLALRSQLLIDSWDPYHINRQRFTEGNFFGFEVTVGVPLFYGATKAKVKAAQKDREVAQLAMQQEQREKERDYKQGYNRLQNAIKRMEYYSGENMAKAKDIERLSTLEYENGEISYVEYASALQEAIDMRLKQAEVVNEYNEAVLALMALNNSL
ncbi:TolC family protein [Prevotella copri]|uniref:TolC family protein n=1 Tax=Segatella copri TaxID=165179 RepID=UPI001C387034|nr:TolC family protein [Segatella copri]MBV3428649.1 TolC family protein [Segatella copri]